MYHFKNSKNDVGRFGIAKGTHRDRQSKYHFDLHSPEILKRYGNSYLDTLPIYKE
ncbi:MAG: hypothetical protein MAG431_00640 [Chloroflexi bacterium]|nr:hypothetical protein [Chloroflexota bacterium]